MSATKAIERHLLAGHTVTPLEALSRWGCYRLGSVIHRLRERHDIQTELVVNPRNRKHSFARYRLKRHTV